MANNRYYIQCPICEEKIFMGKSLGDGLYNTACWKGKIFSPTELLEELGRNEKYQEAVELVSYGEFLREIYNWVWKHMINCHKDEFKGGEIFKIVSDY